MQIKLSTKAHPSAIIVLITEINKTENLTAEVLVRDTPDSDWCIRIETIQEANDED